MKKHLTAAAMATAIAASGMVAATPTEARAATTQQATTDATATEATRSFSRYRIHAFAYRDVNRNKRFDRGDRRLAGYTAKLRNSYGRVVATKRTGTDGYARFEHRYYRGYVIQLYVRDPRREYSSGASIGRYSTTSNLLIAKFSIALRSR